MASISVHIVRSLENLKPQELEWNRLLAASERPHPMSGYAWTSSFVEHFLALKANWYFLFAFDGPRLVGVLPVVESVERGLFGSVVGSLPHNPHAVSVGMTIDPLLKREVVDAFLGFLKSKEPPSLSRLHLFRQRSGPMVDHLSASRGTFLVTTADGGVGQCLPVPTNFEAYRGSLSRAFRSSISRAARRARALSPLRFSFHRRHDLSEGDFQRFGTVEAAGWKGRQGTAIIRSDRLTRFYRDATRRLARAGWLEWHFLALDGTTIAGHLAVRCGRSLLLWKVGYDERFAHCSPGNLLYEEMIRRRCGSRDVDVIDHCTHNAHDRHWRVSEEEYTDVTFYNRKSYSGTLAYLAERTKGFLRPLARPRGSASVAHGTAPPAGD